MKIIISVWPPVEFVRLGAHPSVDVAEFGRLGAHPSVAVKQTSV